MGAGSGGEEQRSEGAHCSAGIALGRVGRRRCVVVNRTCNHGSYVPG